MEYDILHCFADTGAENPCLSRYGNILRIGIDVEQNDYSDVIQADANELPISEETTFDVGWFHPPCGFVSPMSDTGSGSREDWPNLIPLARELGDTHCNDYVIENKPSEHIDEEVVLDGHMFELGIEYARAFETTFTVDQPKRQNRIADTSPFYYTEWSSGEWAACKGSTTEFSKSHLGKNTIPSAYIDYIMRHYYRHVDSEERPDYGTYDKDKKRERREQRNAAVDSF